MVPRTSPALDLMNHPGRQACCRELHYITWPQRVPREGIFPGEITCRLRQSLPSGGMTRDAGQGRKELSTYNNLQKRHRLIAACCSCHSSQYPESQSGSARLLFWPWILVLSKCSLPMASTNVFTSLPCTEASLLRSLPSMRTLATADKDLL